VFYVYKITLFSRGIEAARIVVVSWLYAY